MSRGQILDIHESLDPALKQRLMSLGFRKGEVVECIKKTPFGGPRIFKVGGAVVSLGRDLASEIELELGLGEKVA